MGKTVATSHQHNYKTNGHPGPDSGTAADKEASVADLTARTNAAKHRQHDARFRELSEGLAHAMSEINGIQARIAEREQAGASAEVIRPLEQLSLIHI